MSTKPYIQYDISRNKRANCLFQTLTLKIWCKKCRNAKCLHYSIQCSKMDLCNKVFLIYILMIYEPYLHCTIQTGSHPLPLSSGQCSFLTINFKGFFHLLFLHMFVACMLTVCTVTQLSIILYTV